MTEHTHASLSPSRRTIPAMLQAQAEVYGERPLVVFEAVQWSYRETHAIAARAGAALAAHGVERGDKVAIMCCNRPEFLEMFLGCAWIGAVCVPINTASRGQQLQHILGNCQAKLIVTDEENMDALSKLDAGALNLQAIWVTAPWSETTPEGCAVAQWYPQFAAEGPLMQAADQRPGDTCAIMYTSGTTGSSKGACCPHAQFYWWGVNLAELVGMRQGDVFLSALPLFHANALCSFFVALLHGATVVYERRFSVSSFFQTARARGATVVSLIGAMVPMLLSSPESAEDRRHSIRIGQGGAVPRVHGEAFARRFGFNLVEGYGSTETNVVIGWSPDEQPSYGVMGKAKRGFDVRVVDEDDNEMPDGSAGELVLRPLQPFSIFTGYYRMPEQTTALWRNLWFHTGDRVVRESDGTFRFVDRTKDSIKRRGENISAVEVQDVLRSHPAVQEVAVFPVASELAEDEVMAVVVVRAGLAVPTPQQIVEFCEERMPYFAVPRYLEFMKELPMTSSGKIEKYKLRERGVTSGTWDRVAAGCLLARERQASSSRASGHVSRDA